MTWLGWLASACFTLCGFPLALKTYRDKHADGQSGLFLALWYAGEWFAIAYVFFLHAPWPEKYPMLLNYCVNLACISVPVWYKLKRRLT
jgi:CHASE2 domain-containing sensor protein